MKRMIFAGIAVWFIMIFVLVGSVVAENGVASSVPGSMSPMGVVQDGVAVSASGSVSPGGVAHGPESGIIGVVRNIITTPGVETKIELKLHEYITVDSLLELRLKEILQGYDNNAGNNVDRIGASMLAGLEIGHANVDGLPALVYYGEGDGLSNWNGFDLRVLSINPKSVIIGVKNVAKTEVTVLLGREFKARQGNIFIADNRIKIEVNEIYPVKYQVADVIVAKITLSDYISDPRIMRPVLSPKTVSIGIGDAIEYLGYTLYLTQAEGDVIVLKIQKTTSGEVGPAYKEAPFNQEFKAQAGDKYIVGGSVLFEVERVVESAAEQASDAAASIASALPKVIVKMSYYSSNPTVAYAPKELKFSTVGERQKFNDMIVELTHLNNGVAAFIVALVDEEPIPTNYVEFGEEFKGRVGWNFNVGNLFMISITELDYVTSGTTFRQIQFQPVQCEQTPWQKWYSDGNIQFVKAPTDAELIIAYYSKVHGIELSGVKKIASKNANVCDACSVCPTSYYFIANVREANLRKMLSLGWETVLSSREAAATSTSAGPVLSSATITMDIIPRYLPAGAAVPSREITLNVGESKLLLGGYQITLIAMDDETAKFVVLKRYTISASDSGVVVGSSGSSSVGVVRSVKISPGAQSPEFVADGDSPIAIDSGSLNSGLDIEVQNMGKISTIRVTTNEERLETYVSEGEIRVKTRATLVNDERGLSVELSNGRKADIKILPERASAKAKEVITSNFGDLELKEVGGKIVYEANSREHYRVLGFIPAEGEVSVAIDAEDGNILEKKEPWFAFISSKVKAE